MPEVPETSLGVVILAAGYSSRMGRSKLLLPWAETTVIGHLSAQWSRLRARQIAVVHQAGDSAIAAELDRLQFPAANRIVNPDPDRGMFSSIQCAAAWTGWRPDLTHWAITLGDQPHVRTNTLEALLQFSRQHPDKICQPCRSGRARHPVLLPGKDFRQLHSATQSNLKEFLSIHAGEANLIEIDDPALDLDIDRPEDYERAVRLFLKN